MSQAPDKDLPDEQQVDEYLRGDSSVSRQYRELHSIDVPPELDQLVLRQAHEAVTARPKRSHPKKSRTWVRWSAPLALAASAVLVVSIVIESGVHKEAALSVPMPTELPRQRERAMLPEEADRKQVISEEAAEPAPNAVDQATAKEETSGVVMLMKPTERVDSERALAPADVASEPALSNMMAPDVSAPAESASRDAASREMAAGQVADGREARRAAVRSVAPPLDAVATHGESPSTNIDVLTPELARIEPGDSLATTAAAPAVAPTPSPEQSRPRKSPSSRSELQEIVVTAEHPSSATQRAMRGDPGSVAGPRNSVAARPWSPSEEDEAKAEQPRVYSDPEEWLKDIRQLRKENKQDEANREWRRFRQAFPNFVVSETDSAREVER